MQYKNDKFPFSINGKIKQKGDFADERHRTSLSNLSLGFRRCAPTSPPPAAGGANKKARAPSSKLVVLLLFYLR